MSHTSERQTLGDLEGLLLGPVSLVHPLVLNRKYHILVIVLCYREVVIVVPTVVDDAQGYFFEPS